MADEADPIAMHHHASGEFNCKLRVYIYIGKRLYIARSSYRRLRFYAHGTRYLEQQRVNFTRVTAVFEEE